jgi:hypothetical protein
MRAPADHARMPAVSKRSAATAFVPGAGRPLDSKSRTQMERRFEHDFSQVRVHSDTQASAAARSLNAQAFTVGNDVVLGAGARRGDSLAARELLAHELSHVVQQRPVAQGSSAGISSTSLLDDPALERDADRASIAAALGGRPRVRGRAARLGVQRRVTPQ